MAASTITRSTFTDGTTAWNAAQISSSVYDKIDQMFGGAGSYATFEFGGKVAIVAGTAAAPSFYPTGDTNTGLWFPAGDTVGLSCGGSEALRVNSSRNVCIGVTTELVTGGSARRLNVSGGSGTAATLYSTTAATATGEVWNGATAGDNSFLAFATEASPSVRGSITFNRASVLTAYNTTSDYRAKDILGPVTDAGSAIDALKVYRGLMKGATMERPMLIAHEAATVAPYAVTGSKDAVDGNGNPRYQQMDVSAFVPLLIAELQDLRARVATLEGVGA